MKTIIALSVLLVSSITASAFNHDVNIAEELRIRDGLPNFFAKLARGGDVRIAYLGGSITMADGWRVKTLAHFRAEYPKANIIEINAAISGTGSDYGACRLPDHVLRHNPDLLFVEFRVNGGDLKSMEGMVRQTWAKYPETDICFVYTISEYMVPSLSSGKNVTFGSTLETVANRYGIPTIDFGVEVARQVKDGSLIFKADKAPEGKKIFAKDGTHPGDEGHTIYRDVIVRSFASMRSAGTAGAHVMAEQLDARSWTQAKQAPVTAASLSADWSPVDIATDAIIARGGVRSVKMFPAAMKTSAKGATITIRFNGTTAGFIDIPGPKDTTLTAVIDGKAPITLSRKDAYRTEQTMGRFFFIPEQEPGEHTVRFEVTVIPDGMNYYVGPLLIVGDILPAAK